MLINLDRAKKMMGENGIDFLIASSPENVFYSSDIYNKSHWLSYYSADMFVIIPHHGEQSCVILPASSSGETWIKDVRTYGQPTFTMINEEEMVTPFDEAEYFEGYKAEELLVKTLKDMNIQGKRIVFDNLSISLHSYIREKIPNADFKMHGRIFQEIRMVKTKQEIERLSKVVEITEKALRVMFETIETGQAVKNIMKAIKETAVSEDADVELLIPLGGPELKGGEYVLKNGDLFFADVGLRYNGYLSDFGRTAVIGKASKKVRTYYNAALNGEEEAIKAIEPGVKASDIFRIAVETVRKEGIPHYRRGACGHGIGAGFDLPLISPDDDTILEENMVLEIETPYREIGFGGFMLEDTILVKKKGAEILTKIDRGLRIV